MHIFAQTFPWKPPIASHGLYDLFLQTQLTYIFVYSTLNQDGSPQVSYCSLWTLKYTFLNTATNISITFQVWTTPDLACMIETCAGWYYNAAKKNLVIVLEKCHKYIFTLIKFAISSSNAIHTKPFQVCSASLKTSSVMEDLFDGYDPRVRPDMGRGPTSVTLDLNLLSLQEVDTEHEVYVMGMWHGLVMLYPTRRQYWKHICGGIVFHQDDIGCNHTYMRIRILLKNHHQTTHNSQLYFNCVFYQSPSSVNSWAIIYDP